MNKYSIYTLVSLMLLGSANFLMADSPADYDEICQCVDPFNGVRKIPVVIRDFHASHEDFENEVGSERGIVENDLGSDGRPVYAHGDEGTRTTHGPDNFNQWYKSVDGVNTAINMQLDMTEVTEGFWEYSNSSFFPIDDQGFGNAGNAHNYHFTLETHLKFFYVEGGTFSFKGDDDLWIFINGKLAIDLGGVHSVEEKVVYLDDIADELGIEPNKSYSFDLFFAERHLVQSNFKFQTTFELQCL